MKAEIAERGISVFSKEHALGHAEIRAMYEERISQRLSDLSHHEQVRAFTLLGRGFTLESGELTPSLKVKRRVVKEKYADLIGEML